jgi:hypothetical protein
MEKDGEFYSVTSLRVPPHSRVPLATRISVRGGPAGADLVTTISFRTNDPKVPLKSLSITARSVSGGVVVNPHVVVVGAVKIGESVRRILEVRDKASPTRYLTKVVSTAPDRVKVKLLDVGVKSENEASSSPAGVLIGRVEVRIDTSSSGEVDSQVQIFVQGRAELPDIVRVVGKVAGPIELAPATLSFPRRSSSGLIYSGACLCRSTERGVLSLTLLSAPPGVSVGIEHSSTPSSTVRVEVSYDPTKGSPRLHQGPTVIIFRVRIGELESVVELPLQLEG